MSQKKHSVRLTAEECQQLQTILDTGKHSAQTRKRAKVLLLAHAGKSDPVIAYEAEVSASSVYRLRQRCCEEGVTACLKEKPRPGRRRRLSGHDEAALTAIVCSEPPEGHVRWTHRLLADRLIELEIVDSIAHTTVGRLLKKTS